MLKHKHVLQNIILKFKSVFHKKKQRKQFSAMEFKYFNLLLQKQIKKMNWSKHDNLNKCNTKLVELIFIYKVDAIVNSTHKFKLVYIMHSMHFNSTKTKHFYNVFGYSK